MKIAIIGTGISGLTAAYLLHKHHDITVYEANNYIGGHTATKSIKFEGESLKIDTGFIVYNEKTYPHFIQLMKSLSVETQPTDMGFSVTTRHQKNTDFEYCGSSLNSLFADRKRLLDRRFLNMVADIVRFGKRAKRDLIEQHIDPSITLAQYLHEGQYGDQFKQYYIIPMASAIWSASTTQVQEFNALFFIRFFFNHGLLNLVDRPPWWVITGGSDSYIKPLVKGFEDKIQLSDPVIRVKRLDRTVEITSASGHAKFDQVVFACHSDQALEILDDPNQAESELLSAIPFKENSIIMHSDRSLLPKRKRAWASWNYLLDGSENKQPVLTYNMNILQGIRTTEPVCVTVNGDKHISPDKVIGRYLYSHPQFSIESIRAQQDIHLINGKRRSWFCGAYWRNGFHEDGVVSALQLSQELGGDSLVA